MKYFIEALKILVVAQWLVIFDLYPRGWEYWAVIIGGIIGLDSLHRFLKSREQKNE